MSRTGGDLEGRGSTSPRGGGRQTGQARPAQASGRQSRRTKILGWTSIAVVAVLVAAALVGYLQIRSVYDHIQRVAVTGLGKRPPKYTNAVNILVFGSDRRAGLSRQQQRALHVGTNQGENNTDTIMVLHVSPGRGKVTVLSIPRDTMVPAYACAAGHGHPGQRANPAAQVQINSLFAAGGASCLWKTVEHQTGIRLDHFIELGFVGFVNAINDLGGVNVCLPFPVHDRKSGLKLTKGAHHINGATALAFWRTRYSIGTGTDLQRIQRDQYLLAQVLHGVMHEGLLSSPLRLVRVIRDVAGSLTTDSGMSQTDLLRLAASLSHIHSSNVQFVTAPNMPDPVQPAQVVFRQPQARRLFRAIAHDTTLPKAHRKGSKAGSKRPRVLDIQPSKIKVTVLNGSGAPGVASRAASALTSRGFHVVGTGDASTASGAADFTYTTSVIQYASRSLLPAADTLKKQLSSVTVRRDGSLAPGTIDLILGSSFASLAPQAAARPSAAGRPSATASSAPTPSVSGLARHYGGITGSTSCRGDKAAFTGPNSP